LQNINPENKEAKETLNELILEEFDKIEIERTLF